MMVDYRDESGYADSLGIPGAGPQVHHDSAEYSRPAPGSQTDIDEPLGRLPPQHRDRTLTAKSIVNDLTLLMVWCLQPTESPEP
jgi:hypothetical protein